MKKSYLCMAGAMLLASTAASAQAVKAERGFYVGLEGGAARYDIDVVRSRNVTEKNDAGMLRLGGGYQLSPNFSLEAGYFRIGDTTLDYADAHTREHAKANVSGFDLTAAYRFSEGLPGVYVKGGLIQSTVKETARSETRDLNNISIDTVQVSASGTGYLLGVGYEYDLARSVSIGGGYTRLENLGGRSNIAVNLWSATLKYRF
ncbi:porin family protein [Herbaspirillum seropedicae]|uniref:porin family protein n=1 Tax=Herbaspirillum seropedicae TaxID=964 RepID=UPI003F8D5E23